MPEPVSGLSQHGAETTDDLETLSCASYSRYALPMERLRSRDLKAALERRPLVHPHALNRGCC